jgi:hypothetical protein
LGVLSFIVLEIVKEVTKIVNRIRLPFIHEQSRAECGEIPVS